jgi:hypothetical protein
MSNKKPNTSGITRYWAPGHDARCLLEDELLARGCEPDGLKERIDGFLDALMAVVGGNRRSVFVGVGAFAWSPWTARLPDGRRVETWHLAFKPSRYVEKVRAKSFCRARGGRGV